MVNRFGSLVEQQVELLKYAYENGLKDAIMWIEEYLENVAEAYDMSLEEFLENEYHFTERLNDE